MIGNVRNKLIEIKLRIIKNIINENTIDKNLKTLAAVHTHTHTHGVLSFRK